MPVPLPYPGIFQHSVLRFGDLTEEQSPSYHGMPWNEQTLVYAYASTACAACCQEAIALIGSFPHKAAWYRMV